MVHVGRAGFRRADGNEPESQQVEPEQAEHDAAEEDEGGGGNGMDAGHEHEGEGAHEGHEENSSQRLDLYLSWTPIDRGSAPCSKHSFCRS